MPALRDDSRPVAGRRAAAGGAIAAALLAVMVIAVAGPSASVVEPVQAEPAPSTGTPGARTYGGRPCVAPVGRKVSQCRLGAHGIPDLSRRRFAQLRHQEVTISEPVKTLVANPAAGGDPDWPLIDSLAQPMGRLRYDASKGRFGLTDLAGKTYRVTTVNGRGHGCAASDAQTEGFTLVQIIAPKVPSSGTQAFVDGQALDPTSRASRRFVAQRGGGTGCGPAGPERGTVRPLADPRVGATAHARLSNGTLNTVTEYDAKAPFGDTVYFMSNTTSVRVGGITRGMIRVGTPVAKVDQFRGCDPNSDGTLTWRYWSIRTGNPARPRIYGWIPARCRR